MRIAMTLAAPCLASRLSARSPRRTVWQRIWSAIETAGQRRAAVTLGRIAAYRSIDDPALTMLREHAAAERR